MKVKCVNSGSLLQQSLFTLGKIYDVIPDNNNQLLVNGWIIIELDNKLVQSVKLISQGIVWFVDVEEYREKQINNILS